MEDLVFMSNIVHLPTKMKLREIGKRLPSVKRVRTGYANLLRRERIKAKVSAPPLPTLREWMRAGK